MTAMRLRLSLVAVLFFCCVPLMRAQTSGVLGFWKTPTGSTIRIDRCGGNVCLWIAVLAANASPTDIHNPDAALRTRALCGLEIGSGFTLSDAEHAAGGTLYDPKSGKTYRGMMSAAGRKLHLRGYIGIPLFGASDTWTRVAAPGNGCAPRTE